MRKRLMYPALVTAVFALAVGASGNNSGRGPNHFKASLDGYQETPSTLSTTGRGTFEAKIDDGAPSIEFELSYENLEGGAVTQAHIHLGRPATSGGVSTFLCGGSTKPACPAGDATVTGVIVPSDVLGPAGQGIAAGEFEELVRAIRRGATYANVHTTGRPGGEIRGLIVARGNEDDRGNDD